MVWRVLLVDDSALVRNSMQAALAPYGLELEHAENGAVAVAKAMSAPWDLIFLDVVMPQMDGPTALREIRARGNMTPVVLVTSVSTATVVAGAVKLGNVYYIAKPFTPAHIRAIASKLLKLDPTMLASPPRVLLQHADPAIPDLLRRLLPNHIAIDTTQTLAQSVDLIESGRRELVILESRGPVDEGATPGRRPGRLANLLRRSLPAAGIFAITDDATPASRWQPDEGLDGTLPYQLDAALVDGYLVANFLRPLAMLERTVFRVAGHRGPAAHLPAYIAMLGRSLVDRCESLDHTAELEIDMRAIPPDADDAVTLISHVDVTLRDAGAAPAFRLAPELRAATQGRLERVILL